MPCDYKVIRKDNERRYGTDIGRIGRMLLSDRYDDRTHFIYELLQNAEDALARRAGWRGPKGVSFDLDGERLRVSHYGVPFDQRDVAGVCGIGESTKGLTAIGRFGIGFKSVYAFSDRPEIHSGSENFAIESYVWPVAVEPVEREEEETVILIPLRADDGEGKAEIADGLSRLGASSLLFLREIDEVRWSVDGVPAGLYLRQAVEAGPGVRSVTVVGQKNGEPEVDEEWLVCSREVYADDGQPVGHVEVAWSIAEDEEGGAKIRPVERSRLVVFFPTAVETDLGFLVQGPYRTTPSRDNVPRRDDWNRACVSETAVLLVESMRWLRDHGMLDATALTCLPLDPRRFEESMFRELFDCTRDSLNREDLLPAIGGGHVSAEDGRLARTQELRELLDPGQLGVLEGVTRPLRWLDGQISQDRTPTLRQYLIRVLEMRELTPETLLPRLNLSFLESQSDEWIEGMYEFLGSQVALRRRVRSLPVVRLANGSHVVALVDGEAQAFLPGAVETDFPTVRQTVCQSEGACEFLRSLNLTEPDPVDNVIRNVLPKYRTAEAGVSESEYASDIERMLAAGETDSQSQRDKLVKALGDTPWVRSVDAGNEHGLWAKPGDVYLTTERLRDLFRGVQGVLLVDGRVASLRGEKVRELLERSGAARYLRPVKVDCDLSWQRLGEIRRDEGLERSTWETIEDMGILGLDALLERLPTLETLERTRRAATLWEALGDLHDRRGGGVFNASYAWGFYQERKVAVFDAAFVRVLNEERWISDSCGGLREPASIIFEEVGWCPNGFLESKIRFKPPLVERLAREVGIEPGVLDLLRRLGVTSEAELRERLDLGDEPPESTRNVEDGESEGGTPVEDESDGGSEPSSGAKPGGDSETLNEGDGGDGEGPSSEPSTDADETEDGEGDGGRSEENAPESRFVSYVGVVSEGGETDPDGLEHARRMELEAAAIELILNQEPDWRRTPTNNAGFDLYRGATIEAATEWCEVKAMTGTLKGRPVGMSRTQFEWAQECRVAYWLYVVEKVGTSDATMVRIQDPAGKAMTFTFDHGWRAVAAERDDKESE